MSNSQGSYAVPENIMYDYKRTVASRDKEYHRILENSLADTITPMSEQDCMFLEKALSSPKFQSNFFRKLQKIWL